MKKNRNLIQDYLNQTLSEEELKQFMQGLEKDADLRRELRQYLALDSHLNERLNSQDQAFVTTEPNTKKITLFPNRPRWILPLVASLSFFLGLSLWLFSTKTPTETQLSYVNTVEKEAQALGYAVIEKLVDVEWSDSNNSFQNGQSIGKDTLKIKKGLVQLEFFCGASVIIEGPAELQIQSSWEAYCTQGKIRAHVPPAARGFIIDTAKTRIVDLGTEFGLTVNEEGARIDVFDGTIRLEKNSQLPQEINAGEALTIDQNGHTELPSIKAENFINREDFYAQADKINLQQFQLWQESLEQYHLDEALIVHDGMNQNPLIDNQVGDEAWRKITRGKVILAESSNGRWGELTPKGALEFKATGSRVRIKVPGQLQALTFATWVRIDALNRKLNGLFLTDGFDKNEPHWQINQKGQVIFTVMEDEVAFHKQLKQNGKLTTPDYHTPFLSDSIWNTSQRGQWKHLVTTCDPSIQEVKHYLNGELINSFKSTRIQAPLSIGNAEIGNWGRAVGSSAQYSIRTLNGCMDDFMIFNRALSAKEIQQMYSRSKHD